MSMGTPVGTLSFRAQVKALHIRFRVFFYREHFAGTLPVALPAGRRYTIKKVTKRIKLFSVQQRNARARLILGDVVDEFARAGGSLVAQLSAEFAVWPQEIF
jgi:hypothetical protein